MNSLLLTGGRVIDPANRFDGRADVLICEGKIAAVGPGRGGRAPAGVERMDVSGQVVCPGLIDMHVHLREPGQVAKETDRHRHRGGGARRVYVGGLHAQYVAGD